MIARAGMRWTSGALVALALAGAGVAHAEDGSSVGGSVPSVLALSLKGASGLARAQGDRGRALYTSVVAVEVTATDAHARLSVADGEAVVGRRRGHLVRAGSILPAPLRAAADGGAYRSLDVAIDPPLARWREPVASARTTIRLRQVAAGDTLPALRSYRKLLLVTISAPGP